MRWLEGGNFKKIVNSLTIIALIGGAIFVHYWYFSSAKNFGEYVYQSFENIKKVPYSITNNLERATTAVSIVGMFLFFIALIILIVYKLRKGQIALPITILSIIEIWFQALILKDFISSRYSFHLTEISAIQIQQLSGEATLLSLVMFFIYFCLIAICFVFGHKVNIKSS